MLTVLTHLRTSLESDPDSWENPTLDRYLDAMMTWLASSGGNGEAADHDWRLLADCFRAGRLYE